MTHYKETNKGEGKKPNQPLKIINPGCKLVNVPQFLLNQCDLSSKTQKETVRREY